MVASHELRIGNWVNDFGKPKKILPYDIVYLYGEDDTDFGDMYEPIPLSPEILEKCEGFEKINSNAPDLFRLQINKQIQFRWDSVDGFSIETVRSGWVWNLPGIKYLHEIQNIHLDLTKKELNIIL